MLTRRGVTRDGTRAALVVGGRWRPLHRSLLQHLLGLLRRGIVAGVRRLLRRARVGVVLLCLSLSEYRGCWWGDPTLVQCKG